MSNLTSEAVIQQTDELGAHNYHPLPIVIHRAQGVWVEDMEGRRYMDMLSAYSALNHGHRHPKIIAALKSQADLVTLTSRAFYSDAMAKLLSALTRITGTDQALLMNTGAEAVETAIKAARRFGYRHKKIPPNQAEVIVCSGNFHGRTITVISMSDTREYQDGFEPLTPGFRVVPYGDLQALEAAITPNTAAFLFEPIQGEAGVRIPPEGYLKAAETLCKNNDVLFIADEIQTGFGRTGRMFACDWENVKPDMYILGKALGGGVLPVSAVAASKHVLSVFDPGSHGSTFGGNPLACAVATAALEVLVEEQLPARSERLGAVFLAGLRGLDIPSLVDLRGRGLFIGVQLSTMARPYCERLKELGILCKETHDHVIRFAPPLVITEEELDEALRRIEQVFPRKKV